MKRSWLAAFALSLGWIGSTVAYGQHPNAYNNFAPSSFPMTQQPPTQSVLQSLPQVPQHYHGAAPLGASPYQLVGAQDAGLAAPPVPPPAAAGGQGLLPAPQVPAPLNEAVPTVRQPGVPAPVDYGYQQTIAPSTAACGSAPVSGACGPTWGAPSPGPVAGHALLGGGGHGGHDLGQLGSLPCGAKPWFFGAGALIFQRIDNHNVPLSFRDDSYDTDLFTSQSARMGTTGGFEASVGRYFNCGRNAIQAVYWGLYPTEQVVLNSRTAPGEYASRIGFGFLEMSGTPMAPGDPYAVSDWFNNAYAHELRRSSEFHNVEVNLLGFGVGCASRNFNMSTAGSLFSGLHGRGNACGYCGGAGCGSCGDAKFATGPCCLTAPSCGSRLNLTWLAGFRYFHFRDDLQYAASLDDGVIDRSPDDLYYNVDTTNNLFGFQLGSRADYCVGSRVNLYGNGKVGIYNNRSRLLTRVGTDLEDATLNDTRPIANPGNGGAYDFDVTQDQVAFLSEIGSGVGVRLSPKWTGTVGYRAVIVSGVATAPDNIRQTFANFNDVVDYNTRSTLFLHGLNVGALYNF